MESEEVVRYGELDSTMFDAPVQKRGTSLVVTITRVRDMMGLKEGDMVRVTLEKLSAKNQKDAPVILDEVEE